MTINIKESHITLQVQKYSPTDRAAEILSRELGKEIKYVNIPDEDARKGMKDMGMDVGLLIL